MSENPYNITFLRHGESVGNAEERFQGHADFPLTEKGRLQAENLALRWSKEGRYFDHCFASPLLRARETAEIICTRLGVPITLSTDWKEIDNGLLAGLNSSEAEKKVPRPPIITPYTHYGKTGESVWQLYLRAGQAIQNLLNESPGTYLVTSHGGILNMAIYAILGISPQVEPSGPRFHFTNTAFATFSYDSKQHRWLLHQFVNQNDEWNRLNP